MKKILIFFFVFLPVYLSAQDITITHPFPIGETTVYLIDDISFKHYEDETELIYPNFRIVIDSSYTEVFMRVFSYAKEFFNKTGYIVIVEDGVMITLASTEKSQWIEIRMLDSLIRFNWQTFEDVFQEFYDNLKNSLNS